MKLQMRMDFRLLSETQLEKLLHDALRVWREVPFRIQGTEEFFDYLTDYGCEVDGEMVRFPQSIIDKTLGRIAEQKQKWLSEKTDCENDWPESELVKEANTLAGETDETPVAMNELIEPELCALAARKSLARWRPGSFSLPSLVKRTTTTERPSPTNTERLWSFRRDFY